MKTSDVVPSLRVLYFLRRCNMLSSLYYIDNSLSLFFSLSVLDGWSHITKPAHKLAIIFLIFMFCIEFQPNKTPTLVISDVPQRMKSSIFSFIYNWGLLSRTKRKESKNIFYSLNCMRRFLKIWRFFLLVRIWRRQIENQTLDVIVSEAVLGSNNCTHSMQTCFHSSHLI